MTAITQNASTLRLVLYFVIAAGEALVASTQVTWRTVVGAIVAGCIAVRAYKDLSDGRVPAADGGKM